MRHIDAIKIYQRKTCLIIDDLTEVRGSLKKMMSSFGISHTDTVANARQAIEQCEHRNYDIVLCDYNLGRGRDGQQVLEELRYRKLLKNSSLFLMVTAESSRDMVLGALEYLPDDYLTKPITQKILQTRLNRIVARHEDLMGIKQAIDRGDYEAAIVECQQKLADNGKYTSNYLRIQAELLFRLNRFDEAQRIYESALEKVKPVWAQLGLGKTYLAKKMYSHAEAALESVIQHDTRYVEAHDLLADIYAQQGDFARSQESLQNAVAVSPKSILRQRRLADMATRNNDHKTSLRARQEILRVGDGSCHYRPQDYFDMVTEQLRDKADLSPEQQLEHAKEAESHINRALKRHPEDQQVKLQATASRSRLAFFQNKIEEAQSLLAKAKHMHQESSHHGLPQRPYCDLELVQAMTASGDHTGATALLQNIAKEHEDNQDILNRVDLLSDEPLSWQGRKLAAELTQQGVKLYEDKQFDQAIDVFEKAITLFPNHTGLRLNIVQVVLSKRKHGGDLSGQELLCRKHLRGITVLDDKSDQYHRYEQLLKQVNHHFPE